MQGIRRVRTGPPRLTSNLGLIPDLSAQTDEQPQEAPLATSGSSGAWQLAEESTTVAGGLVDGEGSASAEDGSATIREATAGTVGPSGAEARVASDAPKFRAEKPAVPEEQMALPEASEGMVRPAI